jgi:hypothetical protein
MRDYEKLGVFYLGREWDAAARTVTDRPVLYDSKDLTTHAVCVGMTGSGKTGLCVSLLEEAAIDGIPVVAIDPKGDLGALALAFPELRAQDFRPYVDHEEAARRGMDADAFAAQVANDWKEGLAAWGQGPERIARLKSAADVTLYTPGSEAGVPLGVLRSLAAPPAAVRERPEALRDRVEAAVSGLLALVGVEADPLRSREHILLSLMLARAWRAGRDLDLPSLIGELQTPGVDTVGVIDLETFFPAKERFGLAMQVNALVASPSFAPWLHGTPLDAGTLLYGRDGRPRVSVISIAHLSDRERMFVVTLVLGELVSWMRSQSGTASLRAILYVDEIFGFLPPVAEPPSKRPLLTLLKQARAFGLGVVVATQNPADLDYKALANAGTWFVGRLQTERDRQRLLDGLTGASALAGDRAGLESLLAGLEKRVFLLHDVHEDGPVVFQSRWALSYLRGPLQLHEIGMLTERARAVATAGSPDSQATRPAVPAPGAARARPVVEPGVDEVVLGAPTGNATTYAPSVLATVRLHYAKGAAVDTWVTATLIAPFTDDGASVDWSRASETSGEPVLAAEPEAGSAFGALPGAATRAKTHASYRASLVEWLRRSRPLVVWRAPALRERSRGGESEGEFRARLVQRAREDRDRQMDALRRRYAARLASARDAVGRAGERVERERSQYGGQKMQTAISVGATVLGALLGRRMGGMGSVGRATTAARQAGRAARERDDVARAEQTREEAAERLRALEAEFERELDVLEGSVDPAAIELVEEPVSLRKSDVEVVRLALAWNPVPPGA